MLNRRKKVAVALSGGVDSSVAAALLKKQGFDVVGFHMRLWRLKEDKAKQQELEQRIKQIGKVLGIPIKIFDFKKEFKDCVVNYFIGSYKNGITPNPCVVCNREIKFKLLLEKAKELKCDYLATGHYARLKNTKLLRAKDLNKDQSYFLWGLKLTLQQWGKILFPIGEIESKQKVRQIAKQLNLPTFQTPSSSDVCFLQNTNIHEFLKSRMSTNRGMIVNVKGNVLGEHQGLWFYTIGQRKGIKINWAGLPAEARRAKAGLPWFVVGKDIKKNTLIVSQNEKDLLRKELVVEDVNWVSGSLPKKLSNLKAKVRYRSPLAKIEKIRKLNGKKYKVIFVKPQRAITPGQSVVFYLSAVAPTSGGAKAGGGNELLGGGVIS